MKKNEIIAPKVEKREYFCIVKRLKNISDIIIIGIFALIFNAVTPVSAQTDSTLTDSIEVSLLTCSPHDEVYSLYGHTAIRYRNLKTGEDWAFNYGIFSFKKPFFVLRFALGKTDYELGVVPFEIFKRAYRKFGSQVVEQVLNISDSEKQSIYDALDENYKPQNRAYRYNFFYDNCTTRARDIIERCIDGKIEYPSDNSDEAPTYREIIHEHTRNHPWAAVGNDLCLGFKADAKTNAREQQFIPSRLMYDFDRAQIYNNGEYKPLVKARNIVVAPGVQITEKGFPLSPTACAIILFAASVFIALLEYRKHHIYIMWDAALMLTLGVAGIITTTLLFSEHPTTSTNLQVLLLNPIHLLFIPKVLRKRSTIYWNYLTFTIILFFIGSFFQDYAEGMTIVALSLLTRCWIHIKSQSLKR